jgi:hypothetical protein
VQHAPLQQVRPPVQFAVQVPPQLSLVSTVRHDAQLGEQHASLWQTCPPVHEVELHAQPVPAALQIGVVPLHGVMQHTFDVTPTQWPLLH